MESPPDLFVSPVGSLQLERYPQSSDRSLRAWDAADEYLLDYLVEQGMADTNSRQGEGKRALLVNDTFGAMSCALAACRYDVYHWSDSLLSQLAVSVNFKRNDLDPDPHFVESTDAPPGIFELVLIKVPKTTALLEDQLLRLRAHVGRSSVIVAAGMVRNLGRSSFQSFEKILGPFTTSLARKKARLIFASVDPSLVPPPDLYPTEFTDAEVGFPLFGYANVFSRHRLDAGARHFLQHFNQLPEAASVIDLGCGNGVLGITYQRAYPGAQLCFVDESFMAIKSTRHGYLHQFSSAACNARFVVNDGLYNFADDSVDLILCNPPFHQQHTIDEQTARAMFIESKRCLRQHGELWVVANRHLRYQVSLKHLFGQCAVVAAGPRFTLFRARKR